MNYKLQANIPDVTVKLTPNPLNAKISLTEAAKREFALMVWMQDLIENNFLTARFYLKPMCGKNVDGVYVPNPSEPDKAIKYLEYGEKDWYETWYGEKEGEADTTHMTRMERIMNDPYVKCMIDALEEEHCGDCTCVPSSCVRCHAEDVLGLDTLPSSKHVNRKIGELAWQDYATPEQKERRAELLRPSRESAEKYWAEHPDIKAFHQPRWDQEEKLAKELYAEHLRLYKEQESL